MANMFYTEGTVQRYFQVHKSDSESEHYRLKALSDTRGSYYMPGVGHLVLSKVQCLAWRYQWIWGRDVYIKHPPIDSFVMRFLWTNTKVCLVFWEANFLGPDKFSQWMLPLVTNMRFSVRRIGILDKGNCSPGPSLTLWDSKAWEGVYWSGIGMVSLRRKLQWQMSSKTYCLS